jgi:predicted DCC family thiol-disulfide oxidoreductase YuxK
VRLLKALDRNRRVTAVPFQKSGTPASVGLTLEECKASAWAIAPDGSRYRGAEAVNALVAAALGNAVPLQLYYLPGIRRLQDFIYSLIASNRSRLPGDRPHCAQHPAECR